MDEEVIKLMKKLALLNAVKHKGKANPGAIVGGVLGTFPDLKSNMKEVMPKINELVNEINSLDVDVQEKQLLDIDPEVLEKKHEERDIFGFLNIKEGEQIITAFPPGPEKYPHIGHAKALLLNYELAKRHGGKFILRFEDTNPELVKAEFYDIMLENFKWLNVSWDELVYASDYMDLYYKHCRALLETEKAYYCTCSSEEIKKGRETGVACKCRTRSTKENLALWEAMQLQEPGIAVIRLKIDLQHKNSTMRDPIIFRIIDTPHARLGTKYKVWPNYDFQNSIMDGYLKVTHRLRSKEFEMRNELQRYIQKLLGYKETNIYEFARFNLKGVEASGRIIREKVNSGELIGWDDPSLTTLVALRRRGFQPEAIKEFVLKTGITKNESVLTWDDLIVYNRRLLDDESDRYFFVAEPTQIKIEGAPKKEFDLNLHPTKRKGGRHFSSMEEFFVSKKDYSEMEEGAYYRLIECLNFRFLGGSVFEYIDESVKTYKEKGSAMMHYIPKATEHFNASIMMPDKSIVEGIVESGVKNLEVGDVIQFERMGFCRLDNKEKLRFWFTH